MTIKSEPDYRVYETAARQYLELEKMLRYYQSEEKRVKQKIYEYSNKMSVLSRDKLGLLGHRVVDKLRKEAEHGEEISANRNKV